MADFDTFSYVRRGKTFMTLVNSASLRDKELKTGLRVLGHHEFKWSSKELSCVVEEVCYPFYLIHMNQMDIKLYITHLRGSEGRL
jgi:hypothetical protein